MLAVVLSAFLGGALVTVAAAAPRHARGDMHPGVRFAHKSAHVGGSALVSDGPGTGFGFHRLPGPYRVGALIHRRREAGAVRDAVETDALTTGSFRSGFLGDDVAGSAPYAAYGVYNGADGYGSPYFAGYYGPGDGADLGVFGHAYSDN
jgi:hypothetical protein